MPPPPLEEIKDETPEPSTVEELRLQGGPSLDDLRRALIDAFTTGDTGTVGWLFNESPTELRRPVEILGLLHVVSGVGALWDGAGEEVYEAVRATGDRRNLLVPVVVLLGRSSASKDVESCCCYAVRISLSVTALPRSSELGSLRSRSAPVVGVGTCAAATW